MSEKQVDTTKSSTSRRKFLKSTSIAVAGIAGLSGSAGRSRAQNQVQEQVGLYTGQATVNLIPSNTAESTSTYQKSANVIFRPPRQGDTVESNPLNLVILGGIEENSGSPGIFVVSSATLLMGRVFQHWQYNVTSPGIFEGTLVDTHEDEIPYANLINVVSSGGADSGKGMAVGTQMTGATTESSVGIVVQGMTVDQSHIFDIRISGTLS